VGGWVIAIDAAAEHRNGVTFRLQRTAMSFAVDTAREPTDDDDTGSSEVATEHARYLGAVRRTRAGADDRDGRPGKQPYFTASSKVEPGRWIVDRAEQRRQLAPAQAGHGVASSVGAR
jgi:hypothetical protein